VQNAHKVIWKSITKRFAVYKHWQSKTNASIRGSKNGFQKVPRISHVRTT